MAEVILVEYQVKGLDGLTTELTQASTATEQLNQDLDKTAKATTSAKAQLRQMNNELATMIANGDTSSQKFKELTQRAGQLSDAIQDASGYIKTAGSDTSGLDKALRATNVLVGGFAAVQGATALFGKESENLQKTLLKVNAAMSILAGLQTIQEELSKKDSILTAAATKARELFTAATTAASTATRVLIGVLGGGLLIALTLVIANWKKITQALGIAKTSTEELAEATEKLKKAEESRKALQDAELRYLAAKGASQQQIIQREIAIARLELNKLEAQLKLNKAIAGFAFDNPNDPDNLKKQAEAKKKAVEVEKEYAVVILNARSALLELEKSLKDVNKETETQEENTESTTRALYNFNRAVEAQKTVLGEGGESLAGRLDRLREASAALNKEATGGGGRAGATGVDPVVDTYAKRSAAAVGYFELITNINSQIDSIIQQSQDAQLARLEEQRNQGVITEKQYIQKVQALKKKQAEQDKKLSIFNILLNTAQAISKALTAGPIIGPILAGIVAALGAAELAIAKRTPIPAFRKGVIDLQGPGTATSDSITARLSKGESVMTAEETKNHRDVLLSIRKKQFDRMYMPVNEVLKKNKPMSIPSAQLKGHIDINGGMAVKLDKIYEELVYNNLYTREGNRHTFKIRQAVTKPRASNGIRV